MKMLTYTSAFALSIGLFAATPAMAASVSNLDQYGCRTENGRYRCYQGANDGRTFDSQQDMLNKTSGTAGSSGTNRSTNSNNNNGTNDPNISGGSQYQNPPSGERDMKTTR